MRVDIELDTKGIVDAVIESKDFNDSLSDAISEAVSDNLNDVVSDNLDYDDLASRLNHEEIASNIDHNELASCMDTECLVDYLDQDALAKTVGKHLLAVNDVKNDLADRVIEGLLSGGPESALIDHLSKRILAMDSKANVDEGPVAQPAPTLTEDDVRRIMREEFTAMISRLFLK